MDTFDFDGEQIPLPMMGRSICIEILKLVVEIAKTIPESELKELEAQKDYLYSKAAELSQKKFADMPSDPFNMNTYSVNAIIDDKLPEPVSSLFAADSDESSAEVALCAAAMKLINIICETEKTLLIIKKASYSEVTRIIDPYLLQLNGLYTFLNRLPDDIDITTTRVKRKQGAKQGGAAKAKGLSELKNFVISEAATKYQDQTATIAAKRINSHLNSHQTSPHAEAARTLLKDPEPRFTAWIRDSRKHYH